MATQSQGVQARMAMKEGTGNVDFSTAATPIPFISSSIAKADTIIDNAGLRGTRERDKDSTRLGNYTCQGTVVVEVSPDLLDLLLPWILGTDEAVDVFVPANTLQAFSVLEDRVAGTIEYSDCYVNRATFRGAPNQHVLLELEIWALDEIEPGEAFPSLSFGTDVAARPFVFSDTGLEFPVATSRPVYDWTLTIDNRLNRRFVSGQRNAGSICPTDMLVTVDVTMRFTSTELTALYGVAEDGIDGEINLTNGTVSALIEFGTLQIPDNTPIVPGRSEIELRLRMEARKSGSDESIKFTVDSTP